MAKPGSKPGSKRTKTGQVAKRPGRPPKSAAKAKEDNPAPKRRGRPPKNAAKAESEVAKGPSPPRKATEAPPKKNKGGRPRKNKAASVSPVPQQEQAHSSQEPQEAVLLEVVGTSIQPSFVIQPPSSPRAVLAQEPSPAPNSEDLLDKIPSKREIKRQATVAKKLGVKKTQSLKKTAPKKVQEASEVAADVADDLQQTASGWGTTVWNTLTAPVSYVARRLSGNVQPMGH